MTNMGAVSRDKKTPSLGSVALAAMLEERGRAKKLATRLKVGADLISRWARGMAKPNLKHRQELVGATGIGLFDWDESPAKAARKARSGPEAA
jgi:ribosome-binding protein aMBF1 (putative translation factor)